MHQTNDHNNSFPNERVGIGWVLQANATSQFSGTCKSI